MFQRLALALVVLFACCSSMSVASESQPVVHPIIEKFDVWGTFPPEERLLFYSGWENGLFTSTKDPETLALGSCLEKLSFEQIVATIDKRYAEHHEAFKNPVSVEILNAVTAAGAPCEGKH